MKVFFTKHILIYMALLALCVQGCAKAPEAEDTLIQLAAPTIAPIVTPVPTPVATPTPAPTERPKATEKPKATEPPKEDKATPAPTEKPKSNANTPYADSYTPVELKESSVKGRAFSANTLDGGTITDGYFKEGKITLVNIWTTT